MSGKSYFYIMRFNLKNILVTGAAGFIGYHVTIKLLSLGYNVVGIDNLNNYYDINLKKDRISDIQNFMNADNFHFKTCDISEKEYLSNIFESNNGFDIVINLAAQAGVRYSLTHPDIYVKSNLVGFVNILECCRNYKTSHFIYKKLILCYIKNFTSLKNYI